MIIFENITEVYRRGARPVLDQVNLNIERGEFIFLVETSGSSKSTFLPLVLCEYGVTEGKIAVLGKDLGRTPRQKVPQLRRQLGVVPQGFRLLENKNIYDNVAIALQVIRKPRRVIRRVVPGVLQMVGLGGKDKCFPHGLSDGEQQRVAITCATVNRPPILLADEPTGNLDPTTSLGIMRFLDRISQAGATVVMATYDEEIVNQIRRRVIELNKGHVVRDQDQGVYDGLAPRGEATLGSATDKSGRTARLGHEITTTEGIQIRLAFVLSQVDQSLRRDLAMSVAVIIVACVLLLFVGSIALARIQINNLHDTWYGGIEISVSMYAKNGLSHGCNDQRATSEQINAVETLLRSERFKPYVENVYFESKEEVYQTFKNLMGSEGVYQYVAADVMPTSFHIKLVDPQKYRAVVEGIQGRPRVVQVIDQKKTLEKLFSGLNQATMLSTGLAVVMIVAAMLLVTTTVRLSMMSREHETSIMRLVGASNLFVQLPFMAEGTIAATIDAFATVGVLRGTIKFLTGGQPDSLSGTMRIISEHDVRLISPVLVLAMIILAVLASAVLLDRYTRV